MADNPLQNVTFGSNGRTAHGYLALPESGSGPGVVSVAVGGSTGDDWLRVEVGGGAVVRRRRATLVLQPV